MSMFDWVLTYVLVIFFVIMIDGSLIRIGSALEKLAKDKTND